MRNELPHGKPASIPQIGDVVDTIHGRQEVMDVIDCFPHDVPTMYFRPEHGGREWHVAVARLADVLRVVGAT